MRRTPFNDGWTVGSKVNSFAELIAGTGSEPTPVTLPHDAMISAERSPSGHGATAYFPSGTWEYRKSFEPAPEDAGSAIVLEFDGVYRDARVRVNDTLVAHRPGGYSDFTVQVDHLLRFGEPNEVKVDARAHDDSRWYSGGGIYRSVWWLQGGRVHLVPGGLQVVTPEIDDDVAVVAVSAVVRNQSIAASNAVLRVELLDADGVVAAGAEAPVTTVPGDALTARQRLCLPEPRRWGPDHPSLYTCRATLRDGEVVLDEESTTFGIRSLTVDPARGLRINGEPVLLRGACVHHDNGPLGAATIDRAEERRVELLKEAGFNAIRSAHNPLSKPMLDACDRLGVLVMDETFDMWTQPKSEHDYALRFPDWWEADVEAMVRKDFNHPSVILYSIGNEIPEAGTPMGARVGRALAEKIRSLDSHQVRHRGHQRAAGRRIRALRPARRGSPGRNRQSGEARRGDGREHRDDQHCRSAQRAHERAGRRRELGPDRLLSGRGGLQLHGDAVRHGRRALPQPGDRRQRDPSGRHRHGVGGGPPSMRT